MKNRKGSSSYTYSALLYSQRMAKESPRFLLFHAPASEIVAWADVDRLSPGNRSGAQRPLRELKVKQFEKYLRDQRNTIPTSVVIALDPGAVKFEPVGNNGKNGELGRLGIEVMQAKPGLIIDGQHRVYGANRFAPEMNLNIVAILGSNDAERAFQFVVINNSVSRINRDHIKALNLNYDQDALNKRLLTSFGQRLGLREDKYADLHLIDQSEPFAGLIKWPTNAHGFIAPNAIESALAETYDRSALLGIEDLELDLFLAVWTAIRDLRGNVWNADSKLLKKVSIYALTVYVLDSMIARLRNADELIDFTEESVLRGQVDRVVGRIPEEFWNTEWTAKEMDTSLGRRKLVEALEVIDSNSRFGKVWYSQVSIIDPTLLAGQTYDSTTKDVTQSGRPAGKKKGGKRTKGG